MATGIYHQNRLLGTIEADSGGLVVPAASLGSGPITLRAVALGPRPAEKFAVSIPLELVVKNSPYLPDVKRPPVGLKRGLAVRANGRPAKIVKSTWDPQWLADVVTKAGEPYTIESFFDASRKEVYQFHARHDGWMQLVVDGKVMYASRRDNAKAVSVVPVPLLEGKHRLEIRGTAGAERTLDLRFGGPGMRRVTANHFWYKP